jgi:hypothetical protein
MHLSEHDQTLEDAGHKADSLLDSMDNPFLVNFNSIDYESLALGMGLGLYPNLLLQLENQDGGSRELNMQSELDYCQVSAITSCLNHSEICILSQTPMFIVKDSLNHCL